MGHGRGPRPRSYKAQKGSGEPENQSKNVLSLGFYSHRRLTPIDLFTLFLEEMWENWKPTGYGNHHCASELAFSSRKRGETGMSEIVEPASRACAHEPRARASHARASRTLHALRGFRGCWLLVLAVPP